MAGSLRTAVWKLSGLIEERHERRVRFDQHSWVESSPPFAVMKNERCCVCCGKPAS